MIFTKKKNNTKIKLTIIIVVNFEVINRKFDHHHLQH